MKTLKQAINKISHKQLISDLGYNSQTIGQKTLHLFLSQKEIYSWLDSGYYDFKYTPLEFLIEISKILKQTKYINEKIVESKIFLKEKEKFINSYLYVNTNFKRKNESITILGFISSMKRIKIDSEELVFKREQEIENLIEQKIKKHYKSKDGVIPVFGKILSYTYYVKDIAKKTYSII